MSLVFAAVPTIQYLLCSVLLNGEFGKNQTITQVKGYAKDW